MTKTWIVVPNQNGLRFLPECLESVRERSANATVCLVDNSSSDGSVEYVRKRHPEVHLIELELNLGFVQATNLGLLAGLQAGAEHFALLNNDTRVSAGWLVALEAAANDDASLGIIGSWQNDFSGNPSPRTKAILGRVGRCRESHHEQHQPADGGTRGIVPPYESSPSLIDADWVEGSCLWMRRAVLEQVGFLDPLFAPAYFEEIDFCRRARRAGWRVAMATNSVIEHFGAGSSQTSPARKRQRILSERNYLIYHAADPNRNSAMSLASLFSTVVRRGLKALRRRELSLAEWAKAVAEVTPRMPGIAAKNARDRQNRPCPVLGDRSLSTLEQRYYADRVAEMELTPTRST
jgi:GT2 family glycosyltransferase